MTTIFYIIRKKFNSSLNDEKNKIVDSSEKWLKNLYMIDVIFNETEELNAKNKYEISMEFDFPNWVSNKENISFESFKNNSKYILEYDVDKVKYMRNEIKSIYGQSRGYNSMDRAFEDT